MTPTIVGLRQQHPEAHIAVVVRKGCEGILAGCPEIDEIHTTAAPGVKGRLADDLQLLRTLRRQRFDYAFELGDNSRGRWLSLLSGARKRAVNAALRPLSFFWRQMFHHVSTWNWKEEHRVEKDHYLVAELIELDLEPPPMQFARERAMAPEAIQPSGDFVVFHPATRWERKEWPTEQWIEAGRELAGANRQVIVSCGPDEREMQLAGRIKEGIGAHAVCTDGKLSWAQLAWLLHRAKLFIGVDTAAMHLAAACGCPTVGIFGESRPQSWRPWKVEHVIAGPSKEIPPLSELEARLEFQRNATKMIKTETVLAGARKLLDE